MCLTNFKLDDYMMNSWWFLTQELYNYQKVIVSILNINIGVAFFLMLFE